MELRDLRAFVRVVQVGTVTGAAQELHLVQSTVSQAIARLEREFGVQLLERRREGVRPTPAGVELARHAEPILRAVAVAEHDLAAHGASATGQVRLGVLPSITPFLLTPLLREVRLRHPDIAVSVDEAHADALVDGMRLGKTDLALLWLPAHTRGLRTESIARIGLAAVTASDHRLRRRKSVRLAELGDEGWVTFPPGEPGRTWIDEACASAGFAPRVAATAHTLGEIKAYVEAGVGITLLPHPTVGLETETGVLCALTVAPPEPQALLGCAYSGKPVPAPVRSLLVTLREIVPALLGRAGQTAPRPADGD